MVAAPVVDVLIKIKRYFCVKFVHLAKLMNGKDRPPLLLRRRLSVPETIMRKYSLKQRVNSEEENSSILLRKKQNQKEKEKRNKVSAELRVISNVSLSQPTLDLILNQILKEAKSNFSNSEENRKPNQVIANVDVGSPYGKTRTTIPRYSATPRTASMEVNASSSGHDNGSETDTFVDSLDDLSNLISPPLPDNSENIKSKSNPSFPVFFVPIENTNALTPSGKISELLPAKVKQKLFARQEERQKKQTETHLPKLNGQKPKRFNLKPKRFFPKKKTMAKVTEGTPIKSKIPISVTPSLPKIVDGKSKKTTKIPVRSGMDVKVDRLIANILIDTLHKENMEEEARSTTGKNDFRKEIANTSVQKNWTSFQGLHKHPDSPESTSDEGVNFRKSNGRLRKNTDDLRRRRASSPIDEWSVTVEGSYVPDVEMRLRFRKTDRRKKMVDQKNCRRDIRLPAMRLPSRLVSDGNERWSEMTGLTDVLLKTKTDESKMNSAKATHTLSKNRRLQPVPGLSGVLTDSQLTAILRKFPGLLSVQGNGILPEKDSAHHV